MQNKIQKAVRNPRRQSGGQHIQRTVGRICGRVECWSDSGDNELSCLKWTEGFSTDSINKGITHIITHPIELLLFHTNATNVAITMSLMHCHLYL